MIASRRAAIPTGPARCEPSESGPRWRSVAAIARRRSGSTDPRPDAIPQIPHIGSSLGTARKRLAEHADAGHEHRPQIETDGTVGDPLEIVRELLGHRRLVALTHLCEPG